MSADSAVALLPAVLLGTVLQSMTYGAFLILCIKSFGILTSNRTVKLRQSVMRMTTMGITIFQLVLITGHWALNLSRLFDAFIYADNLPMGSILYYATIAHPKYLTFTALYVLQAVVTDAFMIYRLYVIWGNHRLVCIIPLLSLLTLMIAGPAIIVTFSHLVIGENVFISLAQPYIMLSLGSNLVTNVYCSTMISYKIWRSDRAMSKSNLVRTGTSRLTQTMHIMIDSAALFTAVTLSAFVAYVVQSNFHFICVDIATPTIGICFCMIIVRVGGRVDQAGSTRYGGEDTLKGTSTFGGSDLHSRRGVPIPLGNMSVQITTETVRDDSEVDKMSQKSGNLV